MSVFTQQDTLRSRLAAVLPAYDPPLRLYHLSTPPTPCPALYAPPPAADPEKTFCESHFLLVTVVNHDQNGDSRSTALFAIEILSYTTSSLTTLFVSKADTSGFASLLGDQNASVSPSKILSSTFVSFLLSSRHRPDRNLVISLFARAQGQYLFPGSVEHGKKHVLDDRQLVKWWCRTLDPVLREYGSGQRDRGVESKAYLVVPGHDKYETAGFFPTSARTDGANSKRWIYGHPLRQICRHPNAAPRCQVPHFPDDPKSRFLDDLDDELADAPSSQSSKLESPSKRGNGQWKSVKTLEQFWDMMSFRQECSSGRLVGFLWLVFSPLGLGNGQMHTPNSPSLRPSFPGENSSLDGTVDASDVKVPATRVKEHKRRRLSGPVIPRLPRVKSNDTTSMRIFSNLPEKTECYYWPVRSRGSLIIPEKAYKRATDMLLRLDFADLDVASRSTAKWISEVTIMGGAARQDWGVSVRGTQKIETSSTNKPNDANVLSVQSKRKVPTDGTTSSLSPNNNAQSIPRSTDGSVNALGGDRVRKKAKKADSDTKPAPLLDQIEDRRHEVNTLGSSFLKKKPKT